MLNVVKEINSTGFEMASRTPAVLPGTSFTNYWKQQDVWLMFFDDIIQVFDILKKDIVPLPWRRF